MPKITAFIARSFSEDDEPKIAPIIGFLESFRDAGFFPETAERAEVESVSRKVRGMIDDSQVFVGIFTRRWPVYENGLSLTAAVRLAFGWSNAERWAAPAWVIQESGYALKAITSTRKMILFREKGVELPSLQADLEYIEFDANDFAPAFQKASEMINGLLREASGTVIETIVRTNPPAAEADAEKSPTELEKPDTKPRGLGHFYVEMREAIDAKEWDKGRQAYENGLTLIKKPDVELFWKSTYQRLRYSAGESDGFAALKTLVEENPQSPEPLSALSICFHHFQEYEKSAEYELTAARLAPSEKEALSYFVGAAKSLRKANKPQDGLKVLLEAHRRAIQNAASNLSVNKELYALLKDNKELHLAFAIAEWTLHDNPGDHEFRFALAYDYAAESLDTLSLFHYRILRDTVPSDRMVLNNLGVACAKLDLPILAVDAYTESYKQGNTLAADNLAQRYLTAGFISLATSLINEAMKQEEYEPRLPGTLAAISVNRKNEGSREKALLEEAEKYRRFLLRVGEGYSRGTPALGGTWKFPEVHLPLVLTGADLKGDAQVAVKLPYSPLFGSPGETRQEIRKISFTGNVQGTTCKFLLKTEARDGGVASLLGSSQSSREGYIAFSADGTAGEACVIKDGKPSEFFSITKVAENAR